MTGWATQEMDEAGQPLPVVPGVDDRDVGYVYFGDTGGADGEGVYRHVLATFPIPYTDFDTPRILIDDLPAGTIEESQHVGGAVKIGPDGMLYVSIGDNVMGQDAQRPETRRGVILRLNLDGSPAPGNPLPESPMVWAYGFRNPFDFTWSPDGTMYVADVGGDKDEINIVLPGRNYGWPLITGPDPEGRFADPVWSFPSIGTPSGILAYSGAHLPQYRGDLFVCEFNTQKVRWFRVEEDLGGLLTDMGWVVDGCITTFAEGPDGAIYFSAPDGIRVFRLTGARP